MAQVADLFLICYHVPKTVILGRYFFKAHGSTSSYEIRENIKGSTSEPVSIFPGQPFLYTGGIAFETPILAGIYDFTIIGLMNSMSVKVSTDLSSLPDTLNGEEATIAVAATFVSGI